MNISLSEHFNYKKLFLFTLPSIAMMIFTSIYGIVDGLFVSNVVAFTAVKFIMPVTMILGSVGFVFGTGGSVRRIPASCAASAAKAYLLLP